MDTRMRRIAQELIDMYPNETRVLTLHSIWTPKERMLPLDDAVRNATSGIHPSDLYNGFILPAPPGFRRHTNWMQPSAHPIPGIAAIEDFARAAIMEMIYLVVREQASFVS